MISKCFIRLTTGVTDSRVLDYCRSLKDWSQFSVCSTTTLPTLLAFKVCKKCNTKLLKPQLNCEASDTQALGGVNFWANDEENTGESGGGASLSMKAWLFPGMGYVSLARRRN